MKKFLSIVLALAFLTGMLQIAAFAQDEVENLVPANGEYEVHYYISDALPASARAQFIAFVRGEETDPDPDRNIICTLFGHDYTTTVSSTVTHNVYTTSPKCVQNTYEVKTCTRCGHSETNLIESVRISTCHG